MPIHPTTSEELAAREQELAVRYARLQEKGLRLDLTRGKPSPQQLALADGLDGALDGNYRSPDGVDVRNYGGLDGLPAARQLGARILGVPERDVIAGGNASLTFMYQYLLNAWLHGPLGPETAWRREAGPTRFLCIVPGYDRHFTITESLGFEMLTVRMLENGPDMDELERLVAGDPSIKGIWCVPKYQNPTGHTFSDDTVRRMSRLGTIAGPNFRIMWDNAYAVHDLHDDPPALLDIMDCCRAAGTADSVVLFASTSKITRAGAGVAFMAASPDNLAQFKKYLGVQTIGPDKLNQLRHVRFLPDAEAIRALMRAHAAIVRPRFERVLRYLDEGLTGSADWTRPRGGYFISVDVMPGTAGEVVRLAGEAGVKLTPAGATFPYKRDPADANIRLAPTYPSLDEIDQAMPVFVTAVQLAAVRRQLAG
ncbi:MAG: aminotransferase [Acidobacteria bacterium]|nr:aminotransferase [Acidobacteriota bacterium]